MTSSGQAVIARRAKVRTRTKKEAGCRRFSRWKRCCAGDGGAGPWVVWWPSAVAVQAEAANRPELLRSRAVVVSVVGEVAPGARQVWITKASASEPLMTRRKMTGDIETRESLRPWEEPGGCLSIGQVVSGVEVARAWSGLSCGTCEPAPRCGGRPVVFGPAAGRLKREPRAAETARGRVAMRGAGADRLVVAGKPGNAGGAKGTGRPGSRCGQPPWAGGAG